MGDLAEDFRAMREHRSEERKKIEPSRMKFAQEQLKLNGIQYQILDKQTILVDDYVKFYPFTGWYSGKGIGSGRGIKNLIKRIKEVRL